MDEAIETPDEIVENSLEACRETLMDRLRDLLDVDANAERQTLEIYRTALALAVLEGSE